jgi:hypothetical protein
MPKIEGHRKNETWRLFAALIRRAAKILPIL